MKCMQKVMKEEPYFYAVLINIIYKTEDNEEVNEEKRELFNMVYSGFDKVKFCPAEKDGVVVYENLKNWIEKFRELLINQKQERLSVVDKCEIYRYMDCDRILYEKMIGLVQGYISAYSSRL